MSPAQPPDERARVPCRARRRTASARAGAAGAPALAVALAVALAACGGDGATSAGTARLAEPPAFDTAGMERAVAQLLEARRAAVRARPGDAAAWAALGAALDAHQLLAEADAALGVACALDPRAFAPAYERAFVGGLLGVPEGELVARYDAALALRDDYAPAHLRRGEALLGLGRAEEALAALDRARALDPGDGRAALARARALLALDLAAEATLALAPLAEAYPASRDVLGVYAQALRAAGDVQGAELVTAALGSLAGRGEGPALRDPLRAQVLALTATRSARFGRARALAARGDAAAALALLEGLLEEAPGDGALAVEVARGLVQARRPADALARLERCLAVVAARGGAEPPAALLALAGQLAVELGDASGGLARLEAAAARGGEDLASRHARGSALGQLGRWSEAAGAFLAAADAADGAAAGEFHYLAGLALLEAGRVDEAREELARGERLDPGHRLRQALAARLPAR